MSLIENLQNILDEFSEERGEMPDFIYISNEVYEQLGGIQFFNGVPMRKSTEMFSNCVTLISGPIKYRKLLSTSICRHKWIDYVGFTESYRFCDHCGIKKESL